MSEYCQQLKWYEPGTVQLHGMGWTWSEKLEGMRCLWDGGVSRGHRASTVPWSLDRHTSDVSTGLWSRLGNIIHAPDWWIEALPRCPLDGELYMGRGQFQEVMSVCRRRTPDDRWADVRFEAWDLIPLDVWSPGFDAGAGTLAHTPRNVTRAENRRIALDLGITLVKQEALPSASGILDLTAEIVAHGGEGIVLCDRSSHWERRRSSSILKYKPFDTGSGIVIGHTLGSGRNTGTCGALILSCTGDSRIRPGTVLKINCKGDVMRAYPPAIGQVVSFAYRGLTDGGIPKEARLV